MAETKKIKTALVSVFHKDGLDELLAKLNEEGVKFSPAGAGQQPAGLLPARYQQGRRRQRVEERYP